MTRVEWRFFLIALAIALITLTSVKCEAEDNSYWLTTIGRSYHINREAHYNEDNLGIGLEIQLSRNIRFVAGEYENSLYRHSNYVGAAWLPVKLSEHWSFGGSAIFVSGYTLSPTVAAFPVLVGEWGHFGVNIMSAGLVSAIQLKVGW